MSRSSSSSRSYLNPFVKSGAEAAASGLKAAAAAVAAPQRSSSSAAAASVESKAAEDAAPAAATAAAASSTVSLAPQVSFLRSHLPALLSSVSNAFPIRPLSEAVLELRSKEPFCYEGFAGVAWMMLQIQTVSNHAAKRATGPSAEAMHALAKDCAPLRPLSLQYAGHAADLTAYEVKHSRHALPITFLCGTGGVLATQALAAEVNSDGATMLAAVQSLLAAKARLTDEELPDEILYGRAGYMHALLSVHSHLSATPATQALSGAVQQTIDACFDQIVTRGAAFENKARACPLMWSWHKTKYLGAAHGVTGILYQLMHCEWRFAAAAPNASQLRALVVGTLDYCLSIRLESGNFPSSEKDDAEDPPRDKLVQFCHGAPGLAFACIRAFELFGEARFLQAARESAEVVWQRGLLKKGPGLCHGIAGNAFVFLRLYEVTRDAECLHRAFAFARFALTSDHAEELQQQPDVPASLANGQAGFACLMVDLASKMAEHETRSSSAPQQKEAGAADEKAQAATTRVCFPGFDLLQ